MAEQIHPRNPVSAKKISLENILLIKENIGEKVILDRIDYSDEVVLKDIEYYQHENSYYVTYIVAIDQKLEELYPVDETKCLTIKRSRDEKLLWTSLHPIRGFNTSNY